MKESGCGFDALSIVVIQRHQGLIFLEEEEESVIFFLYIFFLREEISKPFFLETGVASCNHCESLPLLFILSLLSILSLLFIYVSLFFFSFNSHKRLGILF